MSKYPEAYILKACPLCASEDLKPVKTEKNTFPLDAREEIVQFHNTWVQLMECQNCHFGFCKEIPSANNFFEARYDLKFDPEVETQSDFKDVILHNIFNEIEKVKPEKGLLLDIGSFGGITMRFAMQRGFQAEGVEVNPTMAQYTIDKLNLNVFNGNIHQYDNGEEKFDVITLIDVLEHLFEPKSILEKCKKLLKKDGIIIIKVPHFKPQIWKQNLANLLGVSNVGVFAGFGHINHFSKEALDNVMKEIGMEPIECVVARSEMWPGNSLKAKIKNTFRNITYYLMELFRKVTGINLGFNIIYKAKKIE